MAFWLGSNIPVGLIWGIERQVGDMGSVQACEALDLVRKAAVLVASLEQLAPHCMEPLMMLVQQLPMLLPNLQHPSKYSEQESTRMS